MLGNTAVSQIIAIKKAKDLIMFYSLQHEQTSENPLQQYTRPLA